MLYKTHQYDFHIDKYFELKMNRFFSISASAGGNEAAPRPGGRPDQDQRDHYAGPQTGPRALCPV